MFKISDLISFKDDSIVAVDISPASVKALKMHLNSSTNKWIVDCFGRVALDEDIFDGFVVRNEPLLTQAIIELFSTLPVAKPRVAIALPDAAVISKVIQVSQGLDEYEIDELISIEFDKYIPFPIEEVNFDFQVLNASTKNQGLVDVLLVATRKENVLTRLRAFEMAKIDVQLIDVESNLIKRILKFLANTNGKKLLEQDVELLTMIIDIGAYSIKQYVFEGLQLVYVHEDEFGGRQLTNMAASHYGMTQQAFLNLVQTDQIPADFNEEIFLPYLSTAATQVKRLVDYFFSVSRFTQVHQLFLIGGVAELPGLAKMITEQVKIEAETINPFVDMEFTHPNEKEQFLKQASVWVSVGGLAMRRYANPGWLSL